MADPLTTSVRFTQPTIGADTGLWPTYLNSNWAYADEAINQTISVAIPDTNITLTADGTSADQARYKRYNFTGALTAQRTVTIPNVQRDGQATNNTTGGFNVVLSAGGTTLALPADGYIYNWVCDGATNIALAQEGTTALKAASGYVNLPNGILIQWGNGVTSGAGGGALTFPVAFPNNVFSITLTVSTQGAPGRNTVSVANSPAATRLGFAYWGTNDAGAGAVIGFYWMAVGD